MMLTCRFHFLVLVAILLCLCGPAQSKEPPTFVVTDIRCHVKDPRWKEMGIGFGIAALITQHLHDSRLFQAFEDTREVLAQIRAHQELTWVQGDGAPPIAIDRVPADISVSATVLKCRNRRNKVGLALVTKYKASVDVIVEVTLVETATGKQVTAKGKGSSTKGGMAVLFEAKSGKINFNSTMTGIATQNAVQEAFANLLKKYQNA